MKIIHKYFPKLTDRQIQQFLELRNLYEFWNSKINVISRKDINDLYVRHILHSLAIAKVIHFNKGTRILDVGTGGGFPGIPLAIIFPNVEFLLVDSIAKKIKVVEDISSSIKLQNVQTLNSRVERINKLFDFVVSRAVTNMPDFIDMVQDKLNSKHNNSLKNGILYLKGGDLSQELKSISNTQYYIENYFEENFFKTKKVVYIGF